MSRNISSQSPWTLQSWADKTKWRNPQEYKDKTEENPNKVLKLWAGQSAFEECDLARTPGPVSSWSWLEDTPIRPSIVFSNHCSSNRISMFACLIKSLFDSVLFHVYFSATRIKKCLSSSYNFPLPVSNRKWQKTGQQASFHHG